MELEKGRLATTRKELDDARTTRASRDGEWRSEVTRLEQAAQQKSETISLLNSQIEQLSGTIAFEVPLIVPAKAQGMYATQQVGDLSSRPTKRHIQMTAKPEKTEEAANDKSELLLPFGWLSDDADDQATDAKAAKTGRKKSRKVKGEAERAVDVGGLLQAHLATIGSTDAALKQMQAQRKDLGERLAEKADAVEAAEKELKQFQDEKADYSAQQRALSRENEELKVKFSKLLDQFQEYVNETERKVEDETNAQKEVQEKILVDLN